MTTILAGMPGVVAFLDDIVVHGPDQATRNQQLHRLFTTQLHHNLTLNETNSALQVTSFLGMTVYYLWFLPHYSQMRVPLRQLLRKEEPWAWTVACSEAVHRLKTQLTMSPVLAHFDTFCPTVVTCDAWASAALHR
ncbi:hypothetical protein SKAU_G00340650 [Synaphobranchus kaupii]|uniref:Reverse transcriptase/retrotransposon-derived protein RNase H-like domain-containing protein n=1 Tax=Synaphobranchus kaupii TaxID=118154 RepID=A0A9Q1IJH7_SYNKA|nr:hypothetical protein SKAU_G00340650 [Synaphobranchus kaupii]